MNANSLRTFVVVIALSAVAGPTAAQSANRTVPGVQGPPPAAGKQLASEPDRITRCRTHCDTASATGHGILPHQSIVERQARQSSCARKMAS